MLFWIVTGATGGLLWYNQAWERACEQALQVEEDFDDKKGFECLGWLVERISRDKVVRKRLSQLLLRSDRQVYSRLTNGQRKRLMKYLLDMEADRELQEAIISCLVRAGEVKAIPVLEIFLERGRHTACPTELKQLAREGQESLKRFAVRSDRTLPRILEEWNRARAEELLRSSGEGAMGQQTSKEEEG